MKRFIFALFVLSHDLFAGELTRNGSQLLLSEELRCILKQVEKEAPFSSAKARIYSVVEKRVEIEKHDLELLTRSDLELTLYVEPLSQRGGRLPVGQLFASVLYSEGITWSRFSYDFSFTASPTFLHTIEVESCNSR